MLLFLCALSLFYSILNFGKVSICLINIATSRISEFLCFPNFTLKNCKHFKCLLNLKDTIQVSVTIQIIYGKIVGRMFTG